MPDGFLAERDRRFGDTAFRRADHHTAEAVYTRCGCGLARNGYITDAKLWQCAR
ncbi:MAG: hypothetical protein IH607_02995 [Firmicutes bacterium]|nr:hypothetical protein [Bacillota bacterium]